MISVLHITYVIKHCKRKISTISSKVIPSAVTQAMILFNLR